MNHYDDKSLVKQCRVQAYLTQDEYEMLKQYAIQIRAPTLARAAREAIMAALKSESKVTQKQLTFQENKERSKENKEIPLPLGVDSPARPRDLIFFVSKITDDETLRPLAAEFIRGQMAAGVDLERKTDLREHFKNWLPKYQAKMQIAAKNRMTQREQNVIKHEREAKAADQQRQLTEQYAAANTAEAQAERAKVLAKFTKWRNKND